MGRKAVIAWENAFNGPQNSQQGRRLILNISSA